MEHSTALTKRRSCPISPTRCAEQYATSSHNATTNGGGVGGDSSRLRPVASLAATGMMLFAFVIAAVAGGGFWVTTTRRNGGMIGWEAATDDAASIGLGVPYACRLPEVVRGRARRRRAAQIRPYEPVPGTLDLFRRHGIVCPGQTLDDLTGGSLRHVAPQVWHDDEQRRRSGHPLNEPEPKPRPVVVFKRGGSGSTWFDTLLSTHPSVQFQHEAQAFFRRNDTSADRFHILRKFLTTPRIDSTIMRGFSISPRKHGGGIDWGALLKETGSSLVVFIRTNVVKRRVGLLRKGQVKSLPPHCRGSGGGGRIRAQSRFLSNETECSLADTTFVPLNEINKLDYDCAQQSWELLEEAMKTGVPFQLVTYEGMQRNLTETFVRVGQFAGWTDLTTFDWEEGGGGGSVGQRSKTGKVTPESMRKVVTNFEDVKSALDDRPCFWDMLNGEDREIFPVCYMPQH